MFLTLQLVGDKTQYVRHIDFWRRRVTVKHPVNPGMSDLSDYGTVSAFQNWFYQSFECSSAVRIRCVTIILVVLLISTWFVY